ncbi:MAG: dihydrofolate reductase [Odoribacteraceae bacterium]|jgi:lactate dehydrogenase-like 2-hydroxyacid dehydrogenase|nr:dihydrofolate reductase [Odoribacteraceae bacterium]
MRILVTYRIPVESFSALDNEHEYTLPGHEYFTNKELLDLIGDHDALLPIFTRALDRQLVEAGKRLKIISNFGVGYDNIDTVHARSLGITVCNTPRSVCFPTAEMTMGLMLSVARRVSECDRRLRVEKESMWGTMKNLGATLEGRVLGVIGMGNIGQTVARMATAFNMKVIYHNRRRIVDGFERVDLETLLRRSDVVSIHAPLTAETRHLIGERELSMMKPTAFLVNTARGAIVQEEALAACLARKGIAGAGLDVFEDEPRVAGTLYGLDNVVLSPHNATGTIDTRIATGREAVDNILNFFAGRPTNVVN